ncbi:MAG: tetratricopeptide repeat protein [Candidatus Omnitrophota bacterium]
MYMQKHHDIIKFIFSYGLLGALLSVTLLLFPKPIQAHLTHMQELTAWNAKNKILGYQTPDFSPLASQILNNHAFTPANTDNPQSAYYLDFFVKGAELFPEKFEMHYMKGVCLFWAGNIAEAENAFRESLKRNPFFFFTYYNLGLLHAQNGRHDTALKLFEAAKAMPPELTLNALLSLQAFQIIWRYMPQPQQHMINRINAIRQQLNRNNTNEEIKTWHPAFF